MRITGFYWTINTFVSANLQLAFFVGNNIFLIDTNEIDKQTDYDNAIHSLYFISSSTIINNIIHYRLFVLCFLALGVYCLLSISSPNMPSTWKFQCPLFSANVFLLVTPFTFTLSFRLYFTETHVCSLGHFTSMKSSVCSFW